jgi:hypothetical protein
MNLDKSASVPSKNVNLKGNNTNIQSDATAPVTSFSCVNRSCVFKKDNPEQDKHNGVILITKNETGGFNLVITNDNGFNDGMSETIVTGTIPFKEFRLDIYEDKVIARKANQSPVTLRFSQNLDFNSTYIETEINDN